MQATLFTEYTLPATSLWIVAEETEPAEPVNRVEDDGMDWCEWWATYAENLE
ncbi:MAG TPA: hypothetical protein VFS21_34970 [Roseiflexaceae bacterium]|nr:hypothetical protein [Roseiflexaceae bacterium]